MALEDLIPGGVSFVEVILGNALVATVLALAVWVFIRFFRRPAIAHALWLLVLVKLCVPAPVRIPFSMIQTSQVETSQVETSQAETSQIEISQIQAPKTSAETIGEVSHATLSAEEIPSLTHPEGFLIDEEALPAEVLRRVDEGRGAESSNAPPSLETGDLAPAVGGLELNSPVGMTGPRELETRVGNRSGAAATIASGWWTWIREHFGWILSLWVLGSAFWLVRFVVGSHRVTRLVGASSVASEEVRDEVGRLSPRVGLRQPPRVRVLGLRLPPMLAGIPGRATLLLPSGLMEAISPSGRSTLLTHELAHLRRRDHWVRWLEALCVIGFWWLPTTWWAIRELRRFEEECCDAWVVATHADGAKSYAKALLAAVDFLSVEPMAIPRSATALGDSASLRRRVEMILGKNCSPRMSLPARGLVTCLGICVLPALPVIAGVGSVDDPEVVDVLKVKPPKGDGNLFGQAARKLDPAGVDPFGQAARNVDPAGRNPFGQAVRKLDPAGASPFGQAARNVDPAGRNPFGQAVRKLDPAGAATFGQAARNVDPAGRNPFGQAARKLDPTGGTSFGHATRDVDPGARNAFGQSARKLDPAGMDPFAPASQNFGPAGTKPFDPSARNDDPTTGNLFGQAARNFAHAGNSPFDPSMQNVDATTGNPFAAAANVDPGTGDPVVSDPRLIGFDRPSANPGEAISEDSHVQDPRNPGELPPQPDYGNPVQLEWTIGEESLTDIVKRLTDTTGIVWIKLKHHEDRVFLVGLPTDLDASSNTLDPGDQLVILCKNEAALNGRYVVHPDGYLNLPWVGAVRFMGLSSSHVNDLLDVIYAPFLKNPSFETRVESGEDPFSDTILERYALRYTNADEIGAVASELVGGKDGSIHADSRTNSILVAGSSAFVGQVRGVLAELDQPSDAEVKRRVHELEKAAADLSTQLKIIQDELRELKGGSGE